MNTKIVALFFVACFVATSIPSGYCVGQVLQTAAPAEGRIDSPVESRNLPPPASCDPAKLVALLQCAALADNDGDRIPNLWEDLAGTDMDDASDFPAPDIVVAADGSGDYTTLQAAWDAALDGCIIFVKSGTYEGYAGYYDPKSILWLGERGISPPTINGGSLVVGECYNVFEGFVVRHAHPSSFLIFRNCLFEHCLFCAGEYLAQSGIGILACISLSTRQLLFDARDRQECLSYFGQVGTSVPASPSRSRFQFLPEDEEFSLMAASVLYSGLMGYWGFEESSGTISYEGSGRFAGGLPVATLTGTASLGLLGFDGEGKAVNLPSNGGLQILNTGNQVLPATGQPFSIEFWFKSNGWTANQMHGIMGNETYNGSGFRLGIDNGRYQPARVSTLAFWSTESGGSGGADGTTQLETNRWYHVVLSHTGSYSRTYLNGVLDGSGNHHIVGNTNTIRIGHNSIGGHGGFTGVLDELKIYDRALTQNEVQFSYSEGIGGDAIPDDWKTQNSLPLDDEKIGMKVPAGSRIPYLWYYLNDADPSDFSDFLEADIVVGDGEEYETLQAAYDAARDGSIVLVSCGGQNGAYAGFTATGTKRILWLGELGSKPPIIDGDVILTASSGFDGFIFQGANLPSAGAATRALGCPSLKLSNCLFRECETVFINETPSTNPCRLLIEHCSVATQALAQPTAGALFIGLGETTIANSIIFDENDNTGIDSTSVEIIDSIVSSEPEWAGTLRKDILTPQGWLTDISLVRQWTCTSSTSAFDIHGQARPENDATPGCDQWTDSDNDAMPDWWEAANNLDSLEGNDALADPDGDRIPSLWEYLRGSDPQDSDNYPQADIIVAADGSGDYTSLQAAWDAEGTGMGTIIRVKSGIYNGVGMGGSPYYSCENSFWDFWEFFQEPDNREDFLNFLDIFDSLDFFGTPDELGKTILWLGDLSPSGSEPPRLVVENGFSYLLGVAPYTSVGFDGFIFEGPANGIVAHIGYARLRFANCLFLNSPTSIEAFNSVLDIVHCTILRRAASNDFYGSCVSAYRSIVSITNSILGSDYESEEVMDWDSDTQIDGSIIQGQGIYGSVYSMEGILDADGWLTPNSPAAGIGIESDCKTDIFGRVRPWRGADAGCAQLVRPLIIEMPPSQTIILPTNTATLTATARDANRWDLPLTATWSKISGVGTVSFANANSLSTTASFSQAGSYILQLSVSNGFSTTSAITVVNVVSAATDAPTVKFDAPTDQTIITKGENFVLSIITTPAENSNLSSISIYRSCGGQNGCEIIYEPTPNSSGDYSLTWSESGIRAVIYTAVVHDSNGLAASATICVSFLNEGDNGDGSGGFGENNNNGSGGSGSAVRPLPKPQNALGLNSLFQVSVNNSGGSSEQEYELDGEAGQVFFLEVVIGAGGNSTTQCPYHAPTDTAEFAATWSFSTTWGAATSGGDSGISPQDCGIKKLYIVQFPDDPDPNNRKLTFKGKIKIIQGAAARGVDTRALMPTAGLPTSAEHDCADCEYCAVCNCAENCNCCDDCRQSTGKCCDDCNYQDECNYSYDDHTTFLSLGVEPVDITVWKQGTNFDDGVLVKTNDTLEFAISPTFIGRTNALIGVIKWQYRQLKSNGQYTEWKNFQNGDGTKFSSTMPAGGIYRLQARANNDKAQYVRKLDAPFIARSDGGFDPIMKKGQYDFIGVVDKDAQINIRNVAYAQLGATAYIPSAQITVGYGVSPILNFEERDKCNIFVFMMSNSVGISVPTKTRWFNWKPLGVFLEIPPLVKDWHNANYTIPAWSPLPKSELLQPGYIVSNKTHIGILDYDGAWINAGAANINKFYHTESVFKNEDMTKHGVNFRKP